MPSDRYDVTPSGPYGVSVTGPAFDDLVLYIVNAIADMAHPDDERHGLWDAFVTARKNHANAVEDGEDEQWYADVAANAWDDLAPELPSTVRLPHPEARLIAHLIDDRCGRVGIEGKAA